MLHAPSLTAEPLLPAGSVECLFQLESLIGNAATLAASCGTDSWLLAACAVDGGAGDALQLLGTKLVAALKVGGKGATNSLAGGQKPLLSWVLTRSSASGLSPSLPSSLKSTGMQPRPPPQDEGMACLPGLARLPAPDVHNGARALRRRLRQLGSGSLAAGLALLAGNEDERCKLAESLGVDPQVGPGGVAAGHQTENKGMGLHEPDLH